MGVEKNVSASKFPKQGAHLGRRVKVCFKYNLGNTIPGLCVRDDLDSPFVSIFHLDDGRYVLGTECQYALE